jgi:hypothetical protein
MPASLFSAWAGGTLIADYTDNTPAAHDRDRAPALDVMVPVQPVTEVADAFWAGLRHKSEQRQSGSRRNPGSAKTR